jgi:hypothetical protein
MIRLSQAIFTRWALVSTESLDRRRSVSGLACTFPFRRNFVVLAARNPDQPLSEGARRRIGKAAARSPGAVEAPAFGARR